MLKRLFILLFFATVSFAASCDANFFSAVIQNDMQYVGVAFFFSILVLILAYMAGTVFNEQRLLMFYKEEVFHVIFSAILLVSIGGILFFSCTLLSGFLDFILAQGPTQAETFFDISRTGGTTLSRCYSGNESPHYIARCYFEKIEYEARQLMRLLIQGSVRNEMDSATLVTVYTPITGGITIPLSAHLRTFAIQYDIIANSFVTPALMSITMQRILVTYVADFARFILPAAFFLRILAPTRQMGNFLIALTIGFYIIIPVFYALIGFMDDVIFMDCVPYSAFVTDQVFGNCASWVSFWRIARILPQAFFLPNLMLAFIITFISGIYKALKVIG